MREVLEADFREQLEGTYGIAVNGKVEPVHAMSTLRANWVRRHEREEIEAAITHEIERIQDLRGSSQRLPEAQSSYSPAKLHLPTSIVSQLEN